MRPFGLLLLLSFMTAGLALAEDTPRPIEPSLERLAWLAGHWEGEAFGGRIEEVWFAPAGGSMTGMFRLLGDGGLQLIELQMLVQNENGLEFRLKHFDNKFRGWEAADKWVPFAFVRQTENAIYFEGLSFEKKTDDELLVTLITVQKEKKTEHRITYRRVQPARPAQASLDGSARP